MKKGKKILACTMSMAMFSMGFAGIPVTASCAFCVGEAKTIVEADLATPGNATPGDATPGDATPGDAEDESGYWVDEENFPDAIFREFVSDNIDRDNDGYISEFEIANTPRINVNSYGIKNLKGIEIFTELESLDCGENPIGTLDLSNNRMLRALDCNMDQLVELNLENNENLVNLYCYDNHILELNLEKNVNLEKVDCSLMPLMNLKLGNMSNLKWLDCGGGQIKELELSGCPNLTYLRCDYDKLLNLNLNNNHKLTYLDCSMNFLENLDISNNIELLTLRCNDNYLTNLDVSNNLELQTLICKDNYLTYIDVSNNLKLDQFEIGENVTFVTEEQIDISDFEGINLDNVSQVENATLTGTILSFDEECNMASYTYNCGNKISANFDFYHVNSTPDKVTDLKADATNSSAFLSWTADYEAESYNIYRKTDDSKWEKIGATKYVAIYDDPESLSENPLNYVDHTINKGVQYYYSVAAVNKYGEGLYDEDGVSVLLKTVPGKVDLIGATAGQTGITVNWKKMDVADYYIIYRHTSGEMWKKIGTSKQTSFSDKTAIAGVNYSYTVRAVNNLGSSESYDKIVVSAMITSLPGKVNLTDIIVGKTAIKICWEKTPIANSYIIYRHAKGEKWKKIGTSTTTSYIDQTAVGGVNYAYTVKAVNGNGSAIAYDKIGLIAKITARPGKVVQMSAIAGKTTIEITWNKVATANSYIVYRHAKGEAWTKIGTSNTTSYIDTTAVGGKNYAYTVIAVNGNGLSTSYDKMGVISKITAVPPITTLIGATAYTGYINVQWKATATASSYNIYRKTQGGKYTKIGTTTKTAFNDKTAVKGTTYYYTVIAVNGNGSCKTYDKNGVKATAKN